MSLGKIFAFLTASFTRMREHFPFTVQGLITLTLALLALRVIAYGSMDLVVFALAICALAIVMASLLCVIVGGLLTQLRVRKHLLTLPASRTIIVEAGYPNETGFTFPSIGFFPLVRLSWQVIYPDHLDARISLDSRPQLMLEEVIPRRRCKTSKLVRLFTVSDILGFCHYRWRQGQSLSLMALPRSNTIKALPLLRSLTAEDGIPSMTGNPEGDRMEIRPYVPGDSVRNIMWKVYARTRELNVRLAERSVYHSDRTIAYLLASSNDEAAAAVARVAVEAGALGNDWVFGADGSSEPCTTVPAALEAIAASRVLDGNYYYGLDAFLQQQGTQGATHCIVFAAADTGPWVHSLKQTANRFRGRFSLVLATDGFVDETPVKLWRRILFSNSGVASANAASAQQGTTLTARRELTRLLTELGQSVESTLVVDRATGLSFDQRMRKG